ncbi:MAG: RHS repeat-associated core domain-containing protein, partial [Thermoanaerobacterales bacterium]|nr:RHS repeat-associated core domain-containing protein [Thermoanaerobacterales bacterium]
MGRTTTFTYDEANRLSRIHYPGGQTVTYTYDPAGNRVGVDDPNGGTVFTYDDKNRLTAVTRNGRTIAYAFDGNDNLTALTYPGGRRLSYGYDPVNRLISVSGMVYELTVSYDAVGNRVREVMPNGVIVNYAYDEAGRLTVLEHVYDGRVLARFEYTYDDVGNRLSVTDQDDQITRYTYDDLYRLTEVSYPDGENVTYTYDAVGNRTALTSSRGTTTYIYDAADRLVDIDGTPCAYDANGNLLSVGDAVYYAYDAANRLISYTDGEKTLTFSYDGDGNRVGMSVAGSVYAEYTYLNDPLGGIARVLVEEDELSGSGNSYFYAGRLIAREGPEGLIFYHPDALGSTSVISDVYATPLVHYTYDAFGSIRSVTGDVYHNPVLFTGEWQDPSGLIYLRARYYDPVAGRFLTRDTYPGELADPGTLHPYVYCGNNPVIYVDPTGEIRICQEGVQVHGEFKKLATLLFTSEALRGVRYIWANQPISAIIDDSSLKRRPDLVAELRTGWMEVYELKPITYYHRSDLHRRAERQIERYAQDVRGGRGTTLLSTFQGRTVTTISVDPHPRGELETRRTYQLETFPQEPGMIYYREVSSESVLHVN